MLPLHSEESAFFFLFNRHDTLREAEGDPIHPNGSSDSLDNGCLFPLRCFLGIAEPNPIGFINAACSSPALPRRRRGKQGSCWGGLCSPSPPPPPPCSGGTWCSRGAGPQTPPPPAASAFYSNTDPLPDGGFLAALTLPGECDAK